MKLQMHEEQNFNIPTILCCGLLYLMSIFGAIFKVYPKNALIALYNI